MHFIDQEYNFLGNIKLGKLDTQIFYLDKTWVNQNHTRLYCWKISDGSGGLKEPVSKGGCLIICHASSAATGFIPESKLVFRSKKSTSDYHCEMKADTFKKWFMGDFLFHLPPESVLIFDNASYHSQNRQGPNCKHEEK